MKPEVREKIAAADVTLEGIPNYTDLAALLLQAQELMPHNSAKRKEWTKQAVEVLGRIHEKG